MLHRFSETIQPSLIPSRFPNPFVDPVHPIAIQAMHEFLEFAQDQTWYPSLEQSNAGKMFGVLVVEDAGEIGYLAGVSGQLAGSWEWHGLVAPVFNGSNYLTLMLAGEQELTRRAQEIQCYQRADNRTTLEQELACLASETQQALAKRQDYYAQRRLKRREKRAERNCTEQTTAIDHLDLQSQRDKRQWKDERSQLLDQLNAKQIKLDEMDNVIRELEVARREYSRTLQQALFHCYELVSTTGEKKPLLDVWNQVQGRDRESNHGAKFGMPPSGAGDCAAPKLLQVANRQKMKPLALAEFWLGHAGESEIRQHGRLYPPCRGRCAAILPWMLGSGKTERLAVTVPQLKSRALECPVVYEDDDIVVVNKPAGLLSVPGKYESDCVLSRLHQTGLSDLCALIVHRLDLDTSGVMVLARNQRAQQCLQKQFSERSVCKEYVALLEGDVAHLEPDSTASVSLPLRVDLNDRPRQLVCEQHGKDSLTRFKLIDRSNRQARVIATPVTGRTHQIRLHAAHHRGLNAPVVGDPLYAVSAVTSQRMMLHANTISFKHPTTGQLCRFDVPVPF